MTISFSEFQEAHSNYSSTKAYKAETWEEIINILNSRGWNAYEYLDYIFREFRRPMVPSILTNNDNIEAYAIRKEERIVENKRKAAWAIDQVKVRLKNNLNIKDILSEKELENCSVLMYLIAATDKNEEAMDRYRDAAIYDIRIMPEMLSIYSKLFDRRLFPDDK